MDRLAVMGAFARILEMGSFSAGALDRSGYRIPMIMITAFPDERFRTQAMGAGAVCFLNKPVTRRDLVSCIQSALHTTLPESSDEY